MNYTGLTHSQLLSWCFGSVLVCFRRWQRNSVYTGLLQPRSRDVDGSSASRSPCSERWEQAKGKVWPRLRILADRTVSDFLTLQVRTKVALEEDAYIVVPKLLRTSMRGRSAALYILSLWLVEVYPNKEIMQTGFLLYNNVNVHSCARSHYHKITCRIILRKWCN